MTDTAAEFQPFVDHRANRERSRARFAAFPDPLKQALRIAAKRHRWDEDIWEYQVRMLGAAMIEGTASVDELARAYLDSPPDWSAA
jgi:hypothetical protein